MISLAVGQWTVVKRLKTVNGEQGEEGGYFRDTTIYPVDRKAARDGRRHNATLWDPRGRRTEFGGKRSGAGRRAKRSGPSGHAHGGRRKPDSEARADIGVVQKEKVKEPNSPKGWTKFRVGGGDEEG